MSKPSRQPSDFDSPWKETLERFFPEFLYNYRLFDRFHKRVASLAILGDERANWRPDRFEYALWGCRVSLEFPIVKLVDYREQWAELEECLNPFAVVVMTHLKALETRERPLDRQTWKLSLVRRLYQRGYRREDIIGLLRFVDGVLALPEDLEMEFWQEVDQLEEVKRMPYVLSIERIGMKKGAIRQLLRVLQFRFGLVPAELESRLQELDLVRLEELVDIALSSDSLAIFSQHLELEPA